MAKFLSYDDRLEIESGLKEHMSFTESGKKLGRDRTTITKEIKNYSIEQDTGYGSYPHNICKYRKGCKRKKVCGTNDCKHPLVTVCKQCASICNRYCEQFEEEVCTHRFKPSYVCNGCSARYKKPELKVDRGCRNREQRRKSPADHFFRKYITDAGFPAGCEYIKVGNRYLR